MRWEVLSPITSRSAVDRHFQLFSDMFGHSQNSYRFMTSVDQPSPRILIVAPNASSKFGGEAFLPLKYFQILAQRNQPVTLIAHERNREDLEDFLGPLASSVLFVQDTRWHRLIWAVGQFLPRAFRVVLTAPLLNWVNFQFQSRLIRRLMASASVDVIHAPTPVSPLALSPYQKFGVPYVIGPLNGGMSFPEGYEMLEGRISGLLTRLGRFGAHLAHRLQRGKTQATVLLAANERTRRVLRFAKNPTVLMLPENGVDFAVWQPGPRHTPPASAPFRLVFSGRLVDWKAVDITLEAVSLANKRGVPVELDVVGDGPERQRLEALSRALELTDVRFHGFKRQMDCSAIFGQSDALILNSVWECGGAVVLEAMAM